MASDDASDGMPNRKRVLDKQRTKFLKDGGNFQLLSFRSQLPISHFPVFCFDSIHKWKARDGGNKYKVESRKWEDRSRKWI